MLPNRANAALTRNPVPRALANADRSAAVSTAPLGQSTDTMAPMAATADRQPDKSGDTDSCARRSG